MKFFYGIALYFHLKNKKFFKARIRKINFDNLNIVLHTTGTVLYTTDVQIIADSSIV